MRKLLDMDIRCRSSQFWSQVNELMAYGEECWWVNEVVAVVADKQTHKLKRQSFAAINHGVAIMNCVAIYAHTHAVLPNELVMYEKQKSFVFIWCYLFTKAFV